MVIFILAIRTSINSPTVSIAKAILSVIYFSSSSSILFILVLYPLLRTLSITTSKPELSYSLLIEFLKVRSSSMFSLVILSEKYLTIFFLINDHKSLFGKTLPLYHLLKLDLSKDISSAISTNLAFVISTKYLKHSLKSIYPPNLLSHLKGILNIDRL